METKYTPGPWRLTAIPAGNSLTVMVSGSAGYDLIDALGNDSPTNPADARLIAAAPDLVEALARLDALNGTGWEVGRAYISRAFVDEFKAARAQARAALAKAGVL